MVFVYLKKNAVVRLFSSFAHYELTLKGLGHAVLGNFVKFCKLSALNVKLTEQEFFICKIKAT